MASMQFLVVYELSVILCGFYSVDHHEVSFQNPENFDNQELYAPGLAPAKSHVLLTDRPLTALENPYGSYLSWEENIQLPHWFQRLTPRCLRMTRCRGKLPLLVPLPYL